ncbi:hypothetical protein ACFW2V_14045 [Streptomyces sp. NPDC058947]|uniref:hypothetical protein n=1 Tax=Streptomyces sp. NPDC058947 TaxID=3346675 RepID=UPI00368571E3
MATPKKMTTSELNEALHAHFIRPEDRIDLAGAGAVYLTEVTAPDSTRRADAVHIGLWQSRGAGRIDVCELKTDRGDFRRELDKPEKAEAWWPYCNAFWIVAPSVEVAPPEELPRGWGLMVPGTRGRRFKKIVEPEEHEPKITVPLLLTLLKNTETTRTNALLQQQRKLRREAYEQQQQALAQRQANTSSGRRLEALDRLEELMGLKLDDYAWEGRITPETAAESFKTFMQGQAAVDNAKRDARHVLRELDRAARDAQGHADALRKALGVSS